MIAILIFALIAICTFVSFTSNSLIGVVFFGIILFGFIFISVLNWLQLIHNLLVNILTYIHADMVIKHPEVKEE